MNRLSIPATREKIISEMKDNISGDHIFSRLPEGPDKDLLGRSFTDIAEERNMDIATMLCEVLFNNNLMVGYVQLPPNERVCELINKDIRRLLLRSDYMVGSDNILSDFPHPRTYGCFPRLLRFQRDNKFMSLEDLINRMTEVPAKRFRLTDRGTLKCGKAADIVVFDPSIVTDNSSYEHPCTLSTGISDVVVNGKPVFLSGNATGIYSGHALPN